MSDTSIPSLRLSQQEDSAYDILKSSVNLYRGTVCYTQTFFSMPGRSDNDELNISVSAFYQGEDRKKVNINNSDAPTGILGLGWHMDLSYISLEHSALCPKNIRRYTLHIDNNNFSMVREPLTEKRLSIPVSLWPDKEIPHPVLELFHRNGIPLSDTARFEKGRPSILLDDELQLAFEIHEEADAFTVSFLGEAYQTVPYRFWKILYTPLYESWLLVKEDGSAFRFGGGVALQPGRPYKTSEGNSVSWGVCWTDSEGVPVWSGPGHSEERQMQYAKDWHVSRIYSRFGEYVALSYNELPRGDNGLIEDVEQLVSPGGLPYTKACYLTGITDIYGRKASLCYQNKIFDGEIKEYLPSHKSCPDNLPNGYQDCYETKYLEGISVSCPDGSPLMKLEFDYGDGPSVLCDKDGSYAKRLLCGFSIVSPDGERLAGYSFHYMDREENKLAGALKKIIWPTGGEAEYTYKELTLGCCQRNYSQKAPACMPDGAHPGIWCRGELAVMTWYHTSSCKLSLQIAEWSGQWHVWQPAADSALLSEGDGINLETLEVMIQDNFVAVRYDTESHAILYLLAKDQSAVNCWIPAACKNSALRSRSLEPFKVWDLKNGSVKMGAGSDFLIVYQQNGRDYSCTYETFHWNWMQGQWQTKTEKRNNHAVTAVSPSSHMEIAPDGQVNFSFLDPLCQWHCSETRISLEAGSVSQLALAMGNRFAALTYLRSAPGTVTQKYDLYLLSWNEEGALLPPKKFSLAHNNPHNTWSPVIISDYMAAVGGHLIRFDGTSWRLNSDLAPKKYVASEVIRYDYGPDYGIAVHTKSGAPAAYVMSYEPDGQGWLKEPFSIEGLSTPGMYSDTANHPAAGGERHFLIGPRLFYREPNQSWGEALSSRKAADLERAMTLADPAHQYQVNSAAVCIQEPDMLICSMYVLNHRPGEREDVVAVFFLKDGQIEGMPQTLANRRIWSADEIKEMKKIYYPFGNLSFATYPSSDSLYHAEEIMLHRFAMDAVQGCVTDWPVESITVNDGLKGISRTVYCPQGSTASVSIDGRYVKYDKNIYYPGGTPENPVNGSVEAYFLNANSLAGESHVEYCWVMDGLSSATIYRNAGGQEVQAEKMVWDSCTKVAVSIEDCSPKPVYSAYVIQRKSILSRDGLDSCEEYYYAPEGGYSFNGMPVSAEISAKVLNGTEHQVQTYQFACQVYQEAAGSHMLTQVAAAITKSNNIPILAQAVSYRMWPSSYSRQAPVLEQEGEFSWLCGSTDFPFGTPELPQETPEGWLCKKRIERRTEKGQMLRLSYPSGGVSGVRYSTQHALPFLKTEGAGPEQCLWNSFLSYDEPLGWEYCGEHEMVPEAYFGDRSLLLKRGAGVWGKLCPKESQKKYILGIRYKTEKNGREGGAELRCVQEESSSNFLLEGTEGTWRFATYPVVTTGEGAVTCGVYNVNLSGLTVDTLYLVPADTAAQAQFWRIGSHSAAAVMDMAGRVRRTLYDRFTLPIGELYPDGSLKELRVRHTYRQDGIFQNGNLTNTEVLLHASGSNMVEIFSRGDDWKERWDCNPPDSWQIQKNRLLKVDAEKAALVWKGAVSGSKRFTIYGEMVFEPQAEDTLALVFGGGCRITWKNSIGWQLTGAGGEILEKPLWENKNPSGHWMLTVSRGLMVFHFNGRLIFSQNGLWDMDAEIALEAGRGLKCICSLFGGNDTVVTVHHQDGIRQSRQIHQLVEDGSLAAEKIFDALGRVTAVTRPIPGTFGGGRKIPHLAWHDTLVDRVSFLKSIREDGVMHGDTADYYRGQEGRPDDGGYPYWGRRYEDAPIERVSEQGGPGKENSLSGDSNCIHCHYDSSGQPPLIPKNQFLTSTTIDSAGTGIKIFQDTFGRKTAQIIVDPDKKRQNCVTQEYLYRTEGDTADAMVVQRLPNSFSDVEDSVSCERRIHRNTLGQVTRWEDCDTKTTSFIFNARGYKRFVQSAVGEKEGKFLYYRYDCLGRIMEEGIIAADWNRKELTLLADRLDYPGKEDGAVPFRTYKYGEGEEPLSVGLTTAITTVNFGNSQEEADITVTENMEYDENGRVGFSGLSVEGLEGGKEFRGGMRYYYNGLGAVSGMDYPKGGTVETVRYEYDDRGKIRCISSPQVSRPVADYTWTEDGRLSLARKGNVEEYWSYNSAGRVTKHEILHAALPESVFSQEMTYNAHNLMESRLTKTKYFKRGETFQYDYLWRLLGTQAADGGRGTLEEVRYDENGNILQAVQDGKKLQIRLESGSNRLNQAQLQGESFNFAYYENGNPHFFRGIECRYDCCGMRIHSLSGGRGDIRFIYSSKDVPLMYLGKERLYLQFNGAEEVPLFTWDGEEISQYIQGPEHIAAMFCKSGLRYPVSDSTDTVWTVLDEEGTTKAAFDYQPFGGILARCGAEAEHWPFLYHGKVWMEEVSMYSFGARLYDPVLMRFLTADLARQFPSPYIFLGNNPLVMVDPSGNISTVGKVFAFIGFLALTCLGIAGAAGVPILAAQIGGECLGSALAIGIMGGAVAGAVTGLGISGAAYCCTTSNSNFNGKDLGDTLWKGTVSGAIAGAITGGFGIPLDALLSDASAAGIMLTNALANAAINSCSSVFIGCCQDLMNGIDVNAMDLLISAGVGALTGLVAGLAAGASSCLLKNIESRNNIVSSAERITFQTMDKVIVSFETFEEEVKSPGANESQPFLTVSALTVSSASIATAEPEKNYGGLSGANEERGVLRGFLHLTVD